jgi:hypothetical protein
MSVPIIPKASDSHEYISAEQLSRCGKRSEISLSAKERSYPNTSIYRSPATPKLGAFNGLIARVT